jgi:phage baseplate assembly protein gpV
MSVPKMRHVAFSLAVAGVLAGGLLTAVGLAGHGTPGLQAAEPTTPAAQPPSDRQDSSSVRVDAPGTAVNVDKERGRVTVRAPHTDVHVDPDNGRVKVRAPYVNLDISW